MGRKLGLWSLMWGLPLAVTAAASGAEAQTITDPVYRHQKYSAYSTPKGEWSGNIGLLGVDHSDVIGVVGGRVGLGSGFDVGLNLAHFGVGIINLDVGWTFVESGPFAAAVKVAPMYVHSQWLWILDDRQLLDGFDAVVLPVEATASYLATRWLQFDFLASYTDVEFFGYIDRESIVMNAQFGVRQAAVRPTVRFHIMDRLTLLLSGRLAYWTSIPAGATVDVEVGEGIVAGGRTGGSTTVPMSETYRLSAGLRSLVSRSMTIQAEMNYGKSSDVLYANPLAPSVGMTYYF